MRGPQSAPRPAASLPIAVDPQHTPTVYAGGTGTGLFKSTDAGATWKRLPRALAGTYTSGVFKSSDAALALEPGSPATLYVGTAGGSAHRLDPRLLPKPATAAPSPRPRPYAPGALRLTRPVARRA